MKKILLSGLMLIAGAASAETVLVEPGDGHKFVGDRFDARTVNQVLYEDRACKLPIVNAKDMREYSTKLIAIQMKACWGRLLGGGLIIVFEDGDTRTGYENAYVTTTIDKNGNGVVTKSIYKRKP
ncbi:hypothetical protein N5D52_14660 [Pseudomonas sp. GD03860]|uniref:hypothetical protein n=1 Tax=Pseudomonas sp. GD03860 TaxID=2975389 RepID=UPI002449E98B|nr:hypothetical protein [Pseudomonas sp. GD03860]MDH0638186.1 hypothetical protein [Pseudomonas sp. GD03860]